MGLRFQSHNTQYKTDIRGWAHENLKYFLSHNLLYTIWNCKTSWTIWCADPWLISRCATISFPVTWHFSFTMASTAAMASGVITQCAWPGWGESVTELMPCMNFLVQLYTCCSDRHASPYSTSIYRWISMGFSPSLLCSVLYAVLLWCMLQVGLPSLHYYCTVMLHSCIVLPPVGHSSNHGYRCCQLKRQSSHVSNFYHTFKVFIWLSLIGWLVAICFHQTYIQLPTKYS